MRCAQGLVRLTPWIDDPTWGDLRSRVCTWLWARQHGMRIVLGPGAGARFCAQAQWLGLDWDEVAPTWYDLDDAALVAVRSLVAQGRARSVQFETGEIIWWRIELKDTSEVVWDDLIAGPSRQSPGAGWGLYVGLTPDLQGGRPGTELLAWLGDRAAGVTHLLSTASDREAVRQLAIARALGVDPPLLAHLPAVPDDAGAQLAQLEREGFLGHAVAAYAATMAWQAPRVSAYLAQAAPMPAFSLAEAARPCSRFDPQRLLAFNETYLKWENLAFQP